MIATRTRELAYREADGVEVTLLWPVGDSRVVVRVTDTRADESFELSIKGDRALDAFHHPYAFVAEAW